MALLVLDVLVARTVKAATCAGRASYIGLQMLLAELETSIAATSTGRSSSEGLPILTLEQDETKAQDCKRCHPNKRERLQKNSNAST